MSSDKTLILDQTTVDLGDDLLKTKTTLSPGASDSEKTADIEMPAKESVSDWISNSKILLSEGLYDDAKKLLRKVLINDPANAQAPRLLEEVQEIEIQKLLHEEGTSFFRRKKSDRDTREPLQVLHELVDDLHLEVEDHDDSPFPDADAESAFQTFLAHVSHGCHARDRLDLGVALMQMHLYDYAVLEFEKAEYDSDLQTQARGLKAFSLILGGKPFQALLELDPMIENPDIEVAAKIDWVYLMARAYEKLENWKDAIYWYQAVAQIDEQYRDTVERKKQCERILLSSSS